MYNWPRRKILRLQNYDYSSNGAYFITICTKNKEYLLGNVIDGEMNLSQYGKIINKCWQKISEHYQNVLLDEFVIMPNHVHGIIIIPEDWKMNLSNIIKWFKIWTTKEVRKAFDECNFWWQRSFYDVIIRNDDQFDKSRIYIKENPLKWEFDKNNLINNKR